MTAPTRSTYTRRCSEPHCPGHLMCFTCRGHVCHESGCGGCDCLPEPCAWAQHEPDCDPYDEEWPPDTVVAVVWPKLRVADGGAQ